MTDWIAFTLSIGATILLSCWLVKHRKVRIWAFSTWCLTNLYWMLYASNTVLQVQFGVYLLVTLLGVFNNVMLKEEKS